jgi:serine/threonine-protein kinase
VARLAGEPVLQPGTVLSGKIRIERFIGQGSTGLVFEATDLALDRRVAVKMMAPARARSDEARRRFVREARAAAALYSEHVTRLVDVGELHDGVPYLVMEYLVGNTLERLLARDGPQPVDVAVDWILQALDGVAEAHRAGFVHRDLKPENLFLCERPGRQPIVKVLDFGAVKDLVTPGTKLTRTGSTMGSPAYMPPEQVRADPIDARADVWAIGVTLYELITGKLPFGGDSVMQTLAAILRDEPVPLRQLCPDASPDLEALIRCTLSKDPAGRYASANELLAALSSIRLKIPRTTPMTRTVRLEPNTNLHTPPSLRAPAALAETAEMSGFDASRVQQRPRPVVPPAARAPKVLLLVVVAALAIGLSAAFILSRAYPPGVKHPPAARSAR